MLQTKVALLASTARGVFSTRKDRVVPWEYQPKFQAQSHILMGIVMCSKESCSRTFFAKDGVSVSFPHPCENGFIMTICCSLECLLEFMPIKGNA